MISSLASYDLRWADRPLERKDNASSGKLFDQSLSLNADPPTLSVSQTSISEPPYPDSGVNTAIWSSVISEPASREVELRGISYKDDGLMMILISDDDTQNGITTEGWDEIDVMKLGAPETTVSSARSIWTFSASGQKLDLSSFIQSAEQRASDAWQNFFDPKDDDKMRS